MCLGNKKHNSSQYSDPVITEVKLKKKKENSVKDNEKYLLPQEMVSHHCQPVLSSLLCLEGFFAKH